jgi:glutaredoxin 3
MPKVIMYSTRFCPYCVRARMLLEKKGVEFTDIRVDSEPQLREEMTRRASGSSSVPQIFIDDEHVGGCDDLYELELEGQLDKKLGLVK